MAATARLIPALFLVVIPSFEVIQAEPNQWVDLGMFAEPALSQSADIVSTPAHVDIKGVNLVEARMLRQGTITGRVVTAAEGQPLSGVQVYLPELDIGSLTNSDGRFLLTNVPTGQYEITAERLGYYPGSQIVDVVEGETVVINFRLETRVISMQELVVTGIAAETPESMVPFSVEQVTAAEVSHVAHASIGGMLQGTTSGVSVVQGSGLPGSEPSFLLRGPTSITGSQDPLFVVDGVILGGGIADLNPADIQSIEVVKGAAAAALYGSRAQAGVIQITTKSGAGMAEGESQITVRTTFETNDIEHYLGVNGGNPWRVDDQGNFVDVDGNPVDLPAEGRQLAFDDGADGTQASSTFADGEYPPPTYQPQQQFLNPGARLKTHVSVRGNMQGAQYYLSGAFERQNGVITLLDPMEQRQVRLNFTKALGDAFRLSVNSYLSDRSRHIVDQGFIIDITWMTEKANLLRPDPNEPGGISAVGEPILVGNAGVNPVNRLINTRHWEERTRFVGSVELDYTPLSWLTLSGNMSLDRIDQNELYYQRPGLSNLFGEPPTEGEIEKEGLRQEVLNASFTVASNRNFGDLTMRNRFRWLAERRNRHTVSVEGEDLAIDQIPQLGVITSTPEVSSQETSIRSEGFFLINQFIYRNRYIGDFLIRYDGSSLFGADERWQRYWRVSGAWRISEEPWFDLGWITELKPRYSIGTAGGRPSFAAQYETYELQEGGILVPTTLGNDDLKPELATEQEFGLDAIIANRVQFTANYVDTKIENQLLLVPLPSKLGFEAQWQNAGTLESQTWELSVRTAIIDEPEMRWTVSLAADRTTNEITELNVPAFEITGPGLSRSRMLVKEGESLGSFYGFKWLSSCDDFSGDMPCDQFDVNDMGHLVWVGEGNTWRDGVAKDLWGTTGVVNGRTFRWGHPIQPVPDNPLSFTKLGESVPDLNLSLRQNFQWGNFGATIALDGEWGAQVYNFSLQWQCRDWHCAAADMRGVPPEKKKPITYFGSLQAGNSPNSFFLEDASFVKLREVSLRYTVPREMMPAILAGIEAATINLTGRNLKTWTDYRGFDPEVGSDTFLGSAVLGRVDEWFIPNFRSLGVAVELVF